MGNVISQQEQFLWCPVTISITTSASPQPPLSDAPISDDNHNLFSDDEKTLIRQTWSQLQQQQQQPVTSDEGRTAVNRGVRVFMRIFELEPEAQSVFAELRHAGRQSELVASAVFRSHAKRFMTAVDMTVRSLDALDVIVAPTLVRLGRRHVAFAGFQPRYMAVFERAMDDTCAGDAPKLEFHDADSDTDTDILARILADTSDAQFPIASSTTRRHSRDDPREDVGEDVGVGVGVGVVECQLNHTWSQWPPWTTRGGRTSGGGGTAAQRDAPGASCFVS